MRSFFTMPLPSHRIWGFSVGLILVYLLLHPPMVYSQSIAVALGGGLFLLLFKSPPSGSFEVLGRAWWAFLLYLLLSCFWSLEPGLTLQAAGLVFVGTLLYLMARTDGEKNFEVFILVLAVLAAFMAFYQIAFGFDQLKFLLPGLTKMDFQVVEKAIYYQRPTGPLTTSGSLAALLILVIPFAIIQAKTTIGSKRLILGSLTLVLLLALWFTKSVGAWGCLMAAALGIFLLGEGRKWAGWVLAGGIAVILGIIWVRGAHHWGVSSFNMRILLWRSAWDLFLRHPLWGTGLGTFGEAYQDAGFSLVQGGARYPHNIILQLLCETGLMGTVLFAASLFSFARRFKLPYRWEGWGVLAGVGAFMLFSFLDMPFQMPELVWIFSIFLGRLELEPEKNLKLPELSKTCIEMGLLTILLVSGFWPPFRPWNFALLAGALWASMALLGKTFERVPVWVFLGGSFVALRAFNAPSASGTVGFLETAGVGLVFWLVTEGLDVQGSFLRRFLLLGLIWGSSAFFVSFSGQPYEAWANFTNPKHLAVFLTSLVILFFPAKMAETKNVIISSVALVMIARLRATGALIGLTLGFLALPKLSKKIKIPAVIALILAAMIVHGLQPSSTQWDRLLIWKASAQVWGQHFFCGNGPGVFEDEFQRIKEPRSVGFSRYLMEAGYSHNELLEFLTAFGVMGGAFLVFGLWILARKARAEDRNAALIGIGTASLLDFCLHTPRVLLQFVGLIVTRAENRPKVSLPAGFLAIGMALSLFGAAALVPSLRTRALEQESQNHLPEELRSLETAEKLNAWDAQTTWDKGQFLEKLYLATKDISWKTRSDESLGRVLELEPSRGEWYWQKAGLLSNRYMKERSPESLQNATAAWKISEKELPFSAFLRYEEGMFYLQSDQKEEAESSFEMAVQIEPNFAVAWTKLGLLLKMEGKTQAAKEAFSTGLRIYENWNGKPVDPPEKPMLDIPEGVLRQLRLEVRS